MAQLYRQKVLDDLATPEKLDKTIKIASVSSWLLVFGFFLIFIVLTVWAFVGTIPEVLEVEGVFVNNEGVSAIHSDLNGVVDKIYVENGDEVEVGDKLFDIKDDKNKKMRIKSKKTGVIDNVLVEKNTYVNVGTEIIRYTPCKNADHVIVCYVPYMQAQLIKENMDAKLYLMNNDVNDSELIEGRIIDISDYAADVNNMAFLLGKNNLMIEQFVSSGPVIAITCEIKNSEKTINGYESSSDKESNVELKNGDVLNVKIIIEEIKPIEKIFLGIDKLIGG